MTRQFARVFREAVELRIMAEREERLRETRGNRLPNTLAGDQTHDDRGALKALILTATRHNPGLTPSGIARLCECSHAHVIKTQREAGAYRAPKWDASERTWRMPEAT